MRVNKEEKEGSLFWWSFGRNSDVKDLDEIETGVTACSCGSMFICLSVANHLNLEVLL